MRKIRELLRLKFDLGLSIHKIAASLSIARSTVTECLRCAATAKVPWPLPHDLHDDALLYPKKPVVADVPLPDFNYLQRELSRPGVTRLLLWQEYKAQHPDGLQYSAFCDHLRTFLSADEPVMRFEHRAGDNASSTMPAKPQGLSIAPPVRSSKHKSSSLCWAARAIRMPRRPGHSR